MDQYVILQETTEPREGIYGEITHSDIVHIIAVSCHDYPDIARLIPLILRGYKSIKLFRKPGEVLDCWLSVYPNFYTYHQCQAFADLSKMLDNVSYFAHGSFETMQHCRDFVELVCSKDYCQDEKVMTELFRGIIKEIV